MRNQVGFGLLAVSAGVGAMSLLLLRRSGGYDGYLGLMGLLAALGLGIVGLIVLMRSSHRGVSLLATGLLLLLLFGNLAMKCVDGELPFCSRSARR